MKIAGTSKGKGFQGTIKRHNFSSGPKSHGSHNVRAPGSIGASATPSRVFKGIRGPGQMGNKRVTQKGLEIVRVDAAENLLLVRGSVPGPAGRDRGGAQRWLTLPCSARRRAKKVKLDEAAFGARFKRSLVHESVRAEQAARRRGTAATKTRGDGLRRRRQAVAPEGHRPRPRRLEPLAALDRRRHRRSAPSRAPTPSRSTARSAARRCAARCRCTPSAARSRSSTPAAFEAPKTRQALELLADWGQPPPDARGARRGGVRGGAVVPQPRARGRAPRRRTSA